MSRLTICYLPHQWLTLAEVPLRNSVCVVIDVIRATSTIVTALAHGANGIWPVASVAEAQTLKIAHPTALLCGERGGQALPGFDLGNSPRHVTAERVAGRTLILTTTNGTQALAACRSARVVVTASLLNLTAVAARLQELGPPWIILCAGYEGQFGMDDAIVAGALAEALEENQALVSLYHSVQGNLTRTLERSFAGQELFKIGLEADIPFCAQQNLFSLVPTSDANGILRGVPLSP